MPVTVFIKATGEKHRGKFATIRNGKVILYSDVTANGDSGLYGCGENTVFRTEDVDVLAHNREQEIRQD